MKVRMRVDMSGTLNGEPYPKLGEVGELPDTVAEKLVTAGLAVKAGSPVRDDEREQMEAVEERRPAPSHDVETATPKRGPGRPRKTGLTTHKTP